MAETLTGSIERLKNKDGNYMFPITSTSAVYTSNGKTVEQLISEGSSESKMDKVNPEFSGTMVSGTTSSTPGVAGDFLNLSVDDGLIIKDSGYYSQIKKGQIYVNNASSDGASITPGAIRLYQHDANAKLEVSADNNNIISTVKANEIKSGGDVKSTDSSGNTVSLNTLNSNFINLILDKLYPVGSIYLETTNTNPSSKLGGTWVAYGTSSNYLRLGGNGSGGSNSLKLAANQIPSLTTGNQSANHTHSFAHTHGTDSKGAHTHRLSAAANGDTSLTASNYIGMYSMAPYSDLPYSLRGTTTGASIGITSSDGAHTHTTNSQSTSTTGNNSANHTHTYTNNNQQSIAITPSYVQVYAWKRTA